MKRRTQTSLNFAKKPIQPQQSLEVSCTSYDDSNDQSLFKRSLLSNNQNTHLQSILKNKYSHMSTDTMPRRRKAPIVPSVKFQQNQNIDLNQISYNSNKVILELKETVHQLKKKDASYRLEISKLNKQLQLLAEEYSDLESVLKEKDEKINKSNEYILKLDKEIRFFRDEVGKSDRLKGMYSKMMRVEQENEEMRYVIEEQLKEIEDLRAKIKIKSKESSKHYSSKYQNIFQNNKQMMDLCNNLQTYPSSDTERNYHLQITMNPNANYNYQNDFEQSKRKGNKHLSTAVYEDGSFSNQEYVSKLGDLSSLNQFSDYYKSKIEDN